MVSGTTGATMYNSEWVDSLILRLHAPIVDTAEIDIDEDTRRYVWGHLAGGATEEAGCFWDDLS